jgi:hypothetical protein
MLENLNISQGIKVVFLIKTFANTPFNAEVFGTVPAVNGDSAVG